MTIVLVENGRIVQADRLVSANIVMQNGKITSVGRRRPTNFDTRIDAKGLVVLPGLVDAHAHLHDPAFKNREDFTSGTEAAVAGGVTTVIEMVLASPVDTHVRVSSKIEEGKRLSLIDFSLHAGMMSQQNLPNIGEIARLGVRSFKTFTCKPYHADDHTLMSLLRETSMHESILNVHAEDEQIADENFAKLVAEGRKDPLAHTEWKPNLAEERAVQKVVDIARGAKARVHISHMSTREGAAIVRTAKRRKVKVTTETCPHYLTFTRKDMRKQGPYLKMNPCLKGRRDVQALWKGLRDGTIDMVTSEHAPGERAEKEVGWTDIWKAWGGVPSIETMLPVLLSEGVNKRRISLGALQRVCCENPSRVFGIYPQKGTIREGSDGDLVIVNLKDTRKVRADKLHYEVGWTPYGGWTLKGWPIMTLRRGETLYQDKQVVGRAGSAEFLAMSP